MNISVSGPSKGLAILIPVLDVQGFPGRIFMADASESQSSFAEVITIQEAGSAD
jgi:hypothetical protein